MATSTRPTAALVRAVSPRLGEAELTFAERRPIDVSLAVDQHARYQRLLAGLGLQLVALPAAPDHPDGVFVEDLVVVIGRTAVVTRPGVPSRRSETQGLRDVLSRHGLEVIELVAPARLDGGDVLQVEDRVLVGLSTRTNQAGARALDRIVAPLGRRVVTTPVHGALHLKTAVTALPDGAVLADLRHVDRDDLRGRQIVEVAEAAGANVLTIGDTVIVSASAPATGELLVSRGFDVEVAEISEFEKAEAGPTCLSVLLP